MPFEDACASYTTHCDGCHKSAGDAGNCAHYASNALANAGYDILLPHPTINARCTAPSGQKRPVRAKDLRDWIKAHGYTKHSSKPPSGTGCFFYSERNLDGQ